MEGLGNIRVLFQESSQKNALAFGRLSCVPPTATLYFEWAPKDILASKIG